MDLEQALVLRIKAQTPLAGGRIYPLVLPQGPALPAITYARVSTARGHAHDGPPGSATARLQLDCWAARYGDAKALGAQLRSGLDGYRGDLGGVRVGAILLGGDMDDHEPETNRWRVTMDALIWHDE